MTTNREIVCPECGHRNSFYTGINGTGVATIDPEDGGFLISAKSYSIDESDHFDCPICGYETYDFEDFISRKGGV